MKPNILFICCDQLRWDCVGFNNRYPVKTPNIDKIANNGISFENSFTPLPSCCPARQALLCGQRPEKFGALWNYDQGIPVASVNSDAFSWANSLHCAGYKTGYVGKWHVSPTLSPTDFGYEDYISMRDINKIQKSRHPEIKPEVNDIHTYYGYKSPYPYEDSKVHINAENVIQLINKYGENTWHIKMDMPEPHLPCAPSAPFDTMYEDVPEWLTFNDNLENKPYIQKQMRLNWENENYTWNDFKQTVKYYYGYISQVDNAIGMVLDHLEKKGLIDNTVIIFTADHGDMCGSRGMMDKHYVLYDDVVRVPLAISYPSAIKKGIRCNNFVMNMLDIVPTILELAGCDTPDNLDGFSLCPYFDGKGKDSFRNYAYSTFNGQQFGLYVQRMIRNNDFKYIWNLTDVDELYDLKKDPYELVNEIHNNKYTNILKSLRKELYEELVMNDDFTIKNKWSYKQLTENRKY